MRSPTWQPELIGPSLRLRPLRADDFPALHAAASDPGIWAGHPDRERYTREGFQKFFDSGLECGRTLVVHDRKTGAVIGSSRYMDYDPQKSSVEIGFSFLTRAYWGGQHNREMKTLMLDYAFQYVKTCYFVVHVTNVRSQKAMLKLGGVETQDRTFIPVGRDLTDRVVYVLQAS